MEIRKHFHMFCLLAMLLLAGCHEHMDTRVQVPIRENPLPVQIWKSGNVVFVQDTLPEQLVTLRFLFPGGTSALPSKDMWAATALFRHWLDNATVEEFNRNGIHSRWVCGTACSYAEFRFSSRQISESVDRIRKWVYFPSYVVPSPGDPAPQLRQSIEDEVLSAAQTAFLLPSLVVPSQQPLYLDSLSWYAWQRTQVLESDMFILSTGISDSSLLKSLSPPALMVSGTYQHRVPAKGGFIAAGNGRYGVLSADTGTAITILIPGPGTSLADQPMYDAGLRYLNDRIRMSWEVRFENQHPPRFVKNPHPGSYSWTVFRTSNPELALSVVRGALYSVATVRWDTGTVGGILRDMRFIELFSRQESLVRLDLYTERILSGGSGSALLSQVPYPDPLTVEKYWKQLPVYWKVAGCGGFSTIPDSIILRPLR